MNQKAKTPPMEKLGIWFFKRASNARKAERVDLQTYILDKNEREEIKRIAKRAVQNAAIIGIVTSAISSLVSYLAYPILEQSTNWLDDASIRYWSIVMGFTVITSIIELFLLYLDSLNKVFDITRAAHLELFAEDEIKPSIASALARAALELPNPVKTDIHLNPKKEIKKWKVLLSSLIYKFKVSITSFVIRALIKRIMGRAFSRAALEFVSIPVVGFWDAWVTYRVINEVKIRVLGPSAAAELVARISERFVNFSEKAKISVVRAVATCIVTTADLHPNLEFLYRKMFKRTGIEEDVVVDDKVLFLNDLAEISVEEQKTVLEVLVFSAIIDGKISKNERDLLKEAFAKCAIKFDYAFVKFLKNRFTQGKLIELKLEHL